MRATKITITYTTGSAATPALTLSGATGLGALKTTTGYQGETAGYFTVKGENLTTKVTVTAPTGFVVCGSENGTYASSIDITAANAMASAGAKVYVKMSSSASGTYSSKSVTVASSGATSKTQSVSGTTYAAPGLSSTSGSASVTQGDIPEVTVSDYKTGSGTMTYSIKTAPAGVASSAYDISASSGWLVFDTDGVDPGTYTFVVQVQNAAADTHGTETYTWAVTVASASADCWICLETSANGTYYVGDSLASGWWVNWQVNGGWDDGWMKTWVGWQTSGDGYTEYTASWYADVEGKSNKKVHSDIGGYTFKVAQPHYIIAQGQRTSSGPAAADATPGDPEGVGTWTDSAAWPPDGLNTGTAHFTVNAIPVPASMSATTGDAAGKVALSWTKNTPGHNVMVVRYTSGATPTTPTDGTAYAQNASIGSGTVVYNGSGTSYGNTGLTAGTTYDYYFYSVNNNYYSTGTKKSATAAKAPSFATASVTKSTTVGTAASNTQTASGTPSTMTYSVTCTSGGAASSTYSVNSSTGAFSFTPAAAGTFMFTVSASNGVGSAATYTITVTVAPVAPTLTLTGQTAVSVSGTVGCMSGATVTLKRYGTSEAASSDTGGTVVSTSGTGTSRTFTDSGLDACTTYYYKAWQTSGGQTSAASDVRNRTTDGPAAPDVTPSGAGGEITLNWSAVPGAVSYKVNVCETASAGTSSRGGAADGTAAAKRVGRRGATSWTVTLSGGTYDTDHITWTDDTATITQEKWVSTASAVSSSYISAPRVYRYHALVLDAGEGNRWTSVSYTVSGTYFGNSIAWGSSDSAITSANYTSATAGGGEPTYSSGATSTLTFSGGRYAYIYNAGTGSNVQLRPTAITATYEPAQSCVATDMSVSGTSVTFDAEDGVETGKTYSWSVASVGAGGCDTEQDEGTVVVSAAAAAPVWAESVGPWSATVGTELSKTLTESLSTQGSPAPTFSGTAQGTAPAGTYGVTSAGVFTFTPAEGDAGKSFVFRFTASNTQGDPTKDVTVNVAALAPTIAEGTKTLGTTSATLPITVNMRGAATSADITLVYGKTTSYGSSASVSPVRITTGLNAGTAVTGTIASGLEPGTTYSYKWTVQNSAGTTTKTGTFTTLDVAPAVASAGSLDTTVAPGATATLAATGAGAWVTAGTHLTYTLSSSVQASLYTWTAGTGTLAFTPTAAGTYVFDLKASNGQGNATYRWTVTVANAPTITKGEASTSGTTATVPATINAGGALTTVSFVYGTSESYGTSGTVTGGDVSGHANQVSAGQTARQVSVSLSGLTQGTTYYYKWTAVNAGGTTEVTGSFFQPGDGLEFPGQMNGWAQSGTTVRDAEFGGGNYYYTPAVRLTGDQLFKAYKGGTWYGNGYWVTGNNSGHVFTVNENTAENKLCVTETGGGFPPSGAGYYTLRGHDTGSGIEYVALYTENAPVTFTGASDNHAAQGTADVTVTATLSGAKSASEKVYVRYSTDGWTTSSLVQMSGSGTSYTGTIPGQNKGTTVEWYVLTSPHDALADHVDLCTLRGLKNGTDNFTYTTALLPPTVDTVEAGYEKVSLGWNLNAAGNAVMIIRYSSLLPTITPPSDGTAYPADTSALGGLVVYGAYADPSAHPSLENVVSQGTGYTYVFYSVEGSGGSSKYSEGVVRTALAKSLATPTVGVTTAGAGTLTGAAADSGEIYVVARIAGSGSFSGTPSGAAPNAGQSLCGGTVVYKGTAGSFSVADMEGCQTYQYKAWLHAADENAWSAGSSVATVSMPTPAAPVLNALSGITYQGFTASWAAVPGAVTYRMDIVKGSAETTVASYDFNENTTGWTLESSERASDALKIGSGSYGGSADSPTINLSGNGGKATLVFDAWSYGTDTGCILDVWFLTSSDATDWTPLTPTALSIGSTSTSYEFELTGGTETSQISFTTDEKKKRVYVDNIVITQGGSSPVAGWTDKDVSSLMTVSGGVVSVPVTGLEELTTYSVTVRAEGATAACASADSNTQSATTLENDTVTTVTISDADGDGGTTAVAAGAVAAGQTVLVQGTKLVVASGSVNPSLTGMTFTTTGTAGTDDLATFQVRVGTSATFAGTETVKGTVTAGAAGSHTVTFGSAQTLTAGQTYYVWIEAVTKAGATGGNTVGVAALAKDAFAMTGARKNGSTVATGLQTIGNLTAFGAATGASAGGQVDLTWTAGAGGSVLVRWSDVSLEAIPAPGTAWANEATGLTGGSYTVSGVTGCKTHYFKAWEVIDGVACGTARTGTAAASAPAAPTGLGHGTPGAHNASLTWSAAAGAAGYAIDLWHYEGGSSGEGETATYTLATKTSVTVTGTRPTGATEEFTSTYSTVGQMTSGNSQTLTLHGYAGVRITKLTLSMKSNSNGGAGSLTVQVGSGEPVEIVNGAFNTAWHTGWSTSYVDIELPVDVAVGTGQDVVFHIDASANSLYCQSYSVTYSSGTRVDDVIGGVVQAGSAVTVAASGATGVNLGGLADGTTYGWDVKALGTECESAASASDTFTTAELLGAPTIVEPLTAGVEQLGGTITGAAGATMILKRYESEDAAMAATADGSLGGVVVTATEGTGAAAGTWTFADTGLDGCKTYYYRAWQKATVDGEQATSAGSNVASGKTDLGTPTVNAVGAGTQMTISWNAVPGAVSYKVMLTDTEGVWTTTGGGSGTTQLSMDFAGITDSHDTELKSTNLAANGLTGWSVQKVWTVVEEGEGATTLKYVKLGSSSYGGSLATPQIAAMSSGGIATFDLKDYVGGSTADSSTVAVGIKYTGDADFTTLQTFTPSTDWQNYQVSITGTKAFQLQLSSSAGKNRFYIDNLVVTENGSGGGSSGKVGLKYEATVTSAPFERTVGGLTMGETYWYKVIATGAEDCETTSAVRSGTPANAPLIEVAPMHYNFGTVNKNEGGATATFTVRNTGSIALKFSSVALVQDGDAYSITAPTSGLTADLAAGQSRTYTVKFNPQVSGTRTATLRFANDAYNVTEVVPVEGSETYGNLDIPLTGTCYDPATADPTVYWLKVEDELGIEDTVTDQSMAHEDHEPVLTVLTWHYNRSYRTLDGSSKAARWTLYDPSGNVATKANGAALENQPFTAVEDYVYDGKTCAKFSAPIPALGTGKAVRGTYTVKVKVYDSTGTYWTETTHFVPIETGWLFDDFTRADREATGSGALENGWTAMTSGGAVAGEAAIHADALELYGANGECPGVAGRIAVARDMSDVGYATDPHDFVGTGSWGFHFKTGAKTVGFGDGSTAGAFVLGSTASTWLTATPGQVGYAVAMRDDAVQLVKFEGSLLAGGTITQLGEAQYSGTQGKLLAVRVDFLPGQDEVDADAADDGVAHAAVPAKFRLYVKEVAKTGGSPIAECTAADKVLEYEFPEPEDHELRYVGMMWNHGVAQVSDKTGAMFDDIYLPHMEGQTEPMMFHVIDEDTEGPEFYGISLRGAVAAPDVAAHGLTVTGMVHDASGVAGSVAWAIYNGETLLTSGTATPAAVSGSTTEYTLSCAILAGTIDGSIRSADCRFVLTASDGDDDRSENGVNIDSSEGTGSFPFTLCASTPAAPAWATAEADGAELVVLRWARAAAGTQYIVVRSDEEIGDNASPQGRTETMAEGTTVEGWGTVVYNGTGDNHLSGTWTAREFIVAPGSANYFAVYGMTGDSDTGYYFSAPTKPNAYKWETTDEGTGETTVHTAVDGNGVPVASSVAEGGWPCTTAKYEPGEGVDAFAYRTSVTAPGDSDPQRWALKFNLETRPPTGSGWGGAWTGDTDKWKVHDASLLSEGTHYPAPTGNKLYWHDTSHEESSSAEAKLTRQLKNPDSGEFYMAALMNYFEPDTSTGAEGKWIQVALVDASGNDIVSFGMPGWDHYVAAIEYNGGQYCGADNAEHIERDGYHLNSGHGNDYVVVGQLSREDHKFRMWAYYGGQYNTGASQVTIPELYSKKDNGVEVPVSVERTALNTVLADYDFGGTTLPAVAGIQLRAGSVSGKELGHVYFDEVRFANTWEELFLFNAPEVYTYDFDKPDDTSGHLDPENPTDEEGHRQWLISDGALAHGNVGLNAQFGLYHRTGIKEASFTILDDEGNQILKRATDLAPETGGTLAWVTLDGTRGRTYSDWSTDDGGATGVAVPKSKISLDETYTVEVKLKSAGGKEATVTSASETGGAGASDLFFGEYGEGDYWDKYVEIYNGTGHDVDLSQYYLVRLAKDQDYSTTYYGLSLDSTTPYERIFPENSTDPHRWLPHGKTIVLLNDAKIGDSDKPAGHAQYLRYLDRLATMQNVLTLSNCLFHVMSTKVLDAGGDTAYLLITKEAFDNPDSEGNNAGSAYNKAWIDACGLAGESMERTGGKYIMSRKDTAVYLPRSAPDVIDPSEWDYRDWSYGEDDDYPNYENFISTAGWNDRKLGLGGNMEFKVFDDDIEPPTLVRGGVRVRKADGTLEEDYRAVSAGDRTYVVGGWSFTNWPTRSGAEVANLTLAEYEDIATMWPGGLTQNGGLSWASELGGRDLAGWANVIEAGNGKGQSNVEFDGITQRKYGAMIARASGSYAKDDEVWLGFDLDVAQLTDAALTFGFAGGNAGFKNAYVAWSATGEEGTFTMPDEWNFDPNSGGASTWSEWSRSLDTESTGIPASAGHLWFRVYLSDYGTTVGTFRMDNMRVEGAPSVVRVTDAEINSRGMQFEVHVKDEASGLDAGTTGQQTGDDGKAYFDCGLGSMDEFRRVSLVNGGKAESTISWTAADSSGNEVTTGWGAKMAQEWYESTQAGHGKLRLSVPDADDDRAGDQTMLRSDFGMLMVEDDDEAPPVLEMESMKPRQEGTMAEWLLAEKTTLPSETMDALVVGALGLNTTEGTTSRPRYSLRPAADTGLSSPTYAVYQSGWQAGSKYWTVKIRNTSGGAGTITKVSFMGQVGSVLAPTGYTVKYGVVSGGETGAEAGTTWSGSLLTSGSAWVKEGAAEGTTGSPIKTWANYPQTVSIPLAASGTAGDEIELRIYGTGTDPKGIGATWYLWDLKIEGEISVAGEGGEDGYTYVTDASLAQPGGANLPMSGSVYDEGSGLGAVPTYELKRGNKTVSSGEVTFKAARDLSARTSKELGEFEQNIAVSGLGYADLALAEYKGTVHAVDADHDREDAGGNNMDQQDLDGQFAFTVVDQDLVGPTAPANVTVNGTAVVPGETPNRLTVTWTNNPEFLVSFDVAEDVVPTEANLADATWLSNNGVAAASVKKASMQTGAAGIGEYRVSLTTTPAALSNAPAFSVAVAEGALANYGFEQSTGEIGWTIPDGNDGIVSSRASEGLNSLSVGASSGRARNAHQIIACEMDGATTVTVGGTLWFYKNTDNSAARIHLEAFSDEAMTVPVPGGVATDPSYGEGVAQKTWTQATVTQQAFTAPAGTARVYLRVMLYATGAECSFDNVRLGVQVGAAPAAGTADRATMRYVANAAAQGLNVKHLFAVDADNNRAQDRMVGATAPFYTAYDCTPPTGVAFIGGANHGAGASTDHVDDPTTQFDLTWLTSGVGPDDPDDPTGAYTAIPASVKSLATHANDVLSPWGTFRVYYRTYDPVALEAAATEAEASSTADYLYQTLVRGPADGWGGSGEETAFYKDASLGWKHVENGSEIEDVTAPEVGGKRKYSGWDAIGTGAQQTVRLYDLDFDQEYVVVVVGVDKAGNEGPVNSSSWATNNTIKFSLTRGWHMPKADAVTALEGRVSDIGQRLTNTVVSALEWTAAGMTRKAETGEMEGEATKDYDLLQWDARNFRESPDNEWKLLQTVKTNWFVDDGGPTQRGDIRFYRASYKDRWKKAVTNATTGQVTAQTPLVSEEVYAQTAVRLRPGQNFTALHGVPYTNTFRGVFGGLDEFPGGNSSSDGTVIDFYEPNATETKTESYWLHQSGNWLLEGGDGKPVNDIVQDRNFFTRAFSIQLPNTIPPAYVAGVQTNMHGAKPEEVPYLLWKPIAQVPTNGFSRVVECGTAKAPKYNIVALRLPVATHPSKMHLIESGFAQGYPWEADQIYTIDTLTREPGHSCYCDPEGNWQYVAGGNVPWDYFKPNDVLVIVSKNKPFGEETSTSTSWTWTYDPKKFYTLPNRHMQAE